MTSERRLPDKWFYIPIIIIGLYFIYRLVDYSNVMFTFPLDASNDASSYMAQLFFLDKCGFHNFCPYWYNGFISFLHSPPGWYFFALPLLKLFENIQVAFFISIVLSFLLAYIGIHYAGKLYSLSNTKKLAFFLLFFGNAIAIGNFLRLGRAHELFSWVAFIPFAFILIWFKDNKITYKLLVLSGVLFGIVLISYQSVAVLGALLILGLFLCVRRKEKLKVVLMGLISFITASFWLIPFMIELKQSVIPSESSFSEWLLNFSRDNLFTNISSFAIPILIFILFYFYLKTSYQTKKDLLFFGPMLITAFLFMTRLIIYVPVLNIVFPDPYLMFFIFIIAFLLILISRNSFNKAIGRLVPIIIIIACVLSVGINVLHTSTFPEHNELNVQIIELLPEVDGSLLFIGDFPSYAYPKAYYSYSAIFYEINSVDGWYPHVTTRKYLDSIKEANKFFNEKKCEELKDSLTDLNAGSLIAYGEGCEVLNECGFNESVKKQDTCLYVI